MSLLREARSETPMGRVWLAGLAVSLALHAAVVARMSGAEVAPAALVAAGGGGEDPESIEAIAASLVDLVPERAPDLVLAAPQMALPLTAPVIEIPKVTLPDPVLLPPEAPKIAKPAAKPPPEPKRLKKPRRDPPQARTARKHSDSRAASRAAGAGGAAQAGTGGEAAQATLSTGGAETALAKWGATIRARVERRKSYPSAAGRAAGAVGLALTISRAGALQNASVAHSSGHPALDAAALAAVRKAGSFPPAPKGLERPSYAFSLSIKFSR